MLYVLWLVIEWLHECRLSTNVNVQVIHFRYGLWTVQPSKRKKVCILVKVCAFRTSYPVLWQQSALSLRVEYRCKQGRHLGAAGRHQIGWCEMGCQAPLPSCMLPLHFAPRVHEPQSLQLSTTGPAPGLCSPCQIHQLLATWQCHSLWTYVLTMASLTNIPTAYDSLVCQGNQGELTVSVKIKEHTNEVRWQNQTSQFILM